MKTTKQFLSSLYIVGLLSAASAGAAIVENTVKYGEKYFCTVKTADEKSYLLNIEWSAEPDIYSVTPKWKENLKYQLLENSVQVDSGLFSDISLSYSKLTLTFDYNKYVFDGESSFATRVGTNSNDVLIQIKKDYDKDAKLILSIAKFKASHVTDNYYGGVKIKEIELAVVSSECVIEATNKQ